MKVIVDGWHKLNKIVRNNSLFLLFCQGAESKKMSLEMAELARNKQLREAVRVGSEIISLVSPPNSFFRRQFYLWTMGTSLQSLSKQLAEWQQKIEEIDRLAAYADSLEKQASNNPLAIQLLTSALKFYQHCAYQINDSLYLEAIARLQEEIYRRQQFQLLITQGKEEAKQGFFKQALSNFLQAKTLFATKKLDLAIATCSAKIQPEENFEAVLTTARKIAMAGKFAQAIALLEPALAKFPRTDGKILYAQLRKTVKAKKYFRAAILAEKAGNLERAEANYQEAINILPEYQEAYLRLAIVAVKMNNWEQVIDYLQGINGERAAYIRGFAFVQLNNLQQADLEWQTIDRSQVKQERKALKILARRKRLQAMKEIQEFVQERKLEQAKSASLSFMQQFGTCAIVQRNLDEHIRPAFETDLWQNLAWQELVELAENNWLKQQDIISLHNLMIAAYYYSQINPKYLAKLIPIWCSNLANLYINPLLDDIPWLGAAKVDRDSLYSNLLQLLETAIDEVKDRDLETYYQLRDRYRLELASLEIMGKPPQFGLKLDELFLTPSFYQNYREKLKNISFIPAREIQIQQALHSSWGLAVAACLAGDTLRAIQIKPVNNDRAEIDLFQENLTSVLTQTNNFSELDIHSTNLFAESLVAYYEGCYHLSNQHWRLAVTPLQQAEVEIKASPQWYAEIEKLCQNQRQIISHFYEHLDFAQFWCNLTGSETARSYLAQLRVEQIKQKLTNQIITPTQALNELAGLAKLVPDHPTITDAIAKVEFAREAEQLHQLMKVNKFEEAVKLAARSHYEQIPYIVAEICISILVNGSQNNHLSEEAVQQLANWAYQLCPHEPAFQQVYRQFGLYC
ncbi:tetratricopeptide repeat protein [Oscillatoria salina]|uniref:tetratricopeptide repeat protein n=1 Tax=Oscillatoria salina TaxID=331517 RepID=UPI0013B75B7C|nr:tetratricopeptide repeat protein [Oscillatoria salina]MBZ8180425.1 hypothetical protein [Oscillatoria salina IIICB1]NET89021.1 hypothetical protein [Kamptonema sp. SIO1D9]